MPDSGRDHPSQLHDYPGEVTRQVREGRLAEAFVSLADSLVTDYDVVDLLHNLVDYCLELCDVAAAGLVLRDPHGDLEVLASSSEQTRLLELLQLEDGQGPCVECYRTGRVVSVPDVALEPDRWPRFRQGAADFGFVSVHAVPMRLRNDVVGALNLFGTEHGPLARVDAQVAQALADVATIAILQERALRRSSLVTEQLQSALHSRVMIEQAKGVLAQQADVDMEEAFRLLRGYARRNNEKLRDIAAAVVSRRLDLSGEARPDGH